MQLRRKILAVFLLATFAVLPFVAQPTYAQEPTVPLYSVEDFFTFPEVMGYSLAPDGESLIFGAPIDGVINVFTQDIATGEVTQLTFEEEQHVLMFFFKGETLLFMQDEYGDENYSIFRMNNDGTKTNLTPFPGIAMPVDLLEDTYADEEIIIMMNKDDLTMFNIYRLNVVTGDIELVFTAAEGLIYDNDGVSRIIAQTDGGQYFIMHRYSEDEDFELVTTIDHRDHLSLLFFDPTNAYIYAITNIDRETSALVRMDPATAEVLEVIFEHEDYDVSSVIRGFEPGILAGVTYVGDYPHFIFFDDVDDEMGIIYEEALSHFPENTMIAGINIAREKRNLSIVTVASDVNRGQQYLFNREENTMELLSDFNFTTPDHMAPMTPVRYTARDGLEIQGYLTIPVGVEPYNLPVVVIVHGGPWHRDMWGFSDEVQFLANRGYAVFQPNFRGSTGFGRSFLEAGYNEWGLAMQDDITDGVLWLIEEGIADPDRIGIYGGSYGGYATLAGVTFTPDLYAAAISYVGVSSIFTLLESFPPHWDSTLEMWYDRVGHPVDDRERLMATSPIYHVDQITTPLFIAHGANDVRTTLIESVQIVQALNDLDVDVEFMVRWDEGHGFVNEQNRLEFYATMEAFFAENLGGRTGNTLKDLNYTQTLEEVLAVMEGINVQDATPNVSH